MASVFSISDSDLIARLPVLVHAERGAMADVIEHRNSERGPRGTHVNERTTIQGRWVLESRRTPFDGSELDEAVPGAGDHLGLESTTMPTQSMPVRQSLRPQGSWSLTAWRTTLSPPANFACSGFGTSFATARAMARKPAIDRVLAVAALGVAAYLQAQAIVSFAGTWLWGGIMPSEVTTTERIVESARSDLSETEQAFHRPRFVPERKDGRLIGYRVFGVQPGSLYALLGFENGDRIETINGKSATNPAAMLEVYAGWRRADTFVVQLNRRGSPFELTYHLR